MVDEGRMTEKLKGRVTVSRTINLGNYNSKRIEASEEFYLKECSFERAFKEVQVAVDNKRREDEI